MNFFELNVINIEGNYSVMCIELPTLDTHERIVAGFNYVSLV